MDQSTSRLPKPSGLPRPSKLPLLKSTSRPEPAVKAVATKPAAKPATKPTTTRQVSASLASRPRQVGDSVFKKPTKLTSTTLKVPAQSAAIGTVRPKPSTDSLGNVDDFQSASRASSPASSRAEIHSNSQENVEAPKTPKDRKSLAERTVESISKLPPSGSGRRTSSFFNGDGNNSPMPASRQETGYTSRENSSQESLPPVPKLRVSQAAKPAASKLGTSKSTLSSSTRSTTAPKTSTFAGTKTTPAKSSSISTARPTTKPTPSKPTTPSAATRPSKPRPALASRAPNSKTKATTPKAAGTKNAATERSPSNPAKSSAALREQIRQARAAKRVEPDSASKPTEDSGAQNRFSDPTEFASFDFGLADDSMNADDPFNQKPKVGVSALRKRVDMARSDGRLNIAGLGLSEIPEDVIKMYDYEFNKKQNSNVVWNEAVDLSKFIAADNELTQIPDEVFPDVDPQNMYAVEAEDVPEMVFAAIEVLDLHGNLLSNIPMGVRRLERLTILNLARNQFTGEIMSTICQIPTIKDLKLSENQLSGELDESIGNLTQLEVLELQNNQLTALPASISSLTSLKTLNISNNKLKSLPTEALASTSIVQLIAFKNQLSGFLFEGISSGFEKLQQLDVSVNTLTSFSDAELDLVSLRELNISFNRIASLPRMNTWTLLISFLAEDNKIAELPQGLTDLRENLRLVDLQGNELAKLDPKIGKMTALETLKIGANPMRERKFLTMGTEEVKRDMRGRLGLDEEGEEVD